MRRKIFKYLLALFAFFTIGIILATFNIKNTSDELSRLIKLHQINELRQDLIIHIQTTQTNLYTLATPHAAPLDAIVENVLIVEESAKKCTGCHHTKEMMVRLNNIQKEIASYKEALSLYITSSANTERIDRIKLDAATIGNKLLGQTEEIAFEASKKLGDMTSSAMNKIHSARQILFVTLFLTFFLGIYVAVRLTEFIARPITNLVDATRRIANGDLGYAVDYTDTTELGELSINFNTMSAALKESYDQFLVEINERTQAEEALRKSESFLSVIFNSIRDPFCIIDRDFQIVRVNEAYTELKGMTKAELEGTHCYKKMYGRESICDNCTIEKTLQSGDSIAKDKLVHLEDGTRQWLEIFTYPIQDNEGKITHVIEYIRDITERKRTEEALRESRERYALAAQGANDGLWDWDLKEGTVYYSPRWKEMLGFGENEISNSPDEWLERIHPDDRRSLEAQIATHINGGSVHFESEARILHKNGAYIWVLNRGIAVRDADGKAIRMAGSQSDITERKNAEEQLLHDAFHDSLTGLPNRALFVDRLGHIIDVAQRNTGHAFAVLFVDLDRFKVINDNLGHIVGDEVLKEVASRLSKCIRPGDTVARFGGDEFAVILEDFNGVGGVIYVAERVMNTIQKVINIGEKEIFVGISIGIALGNSTYKNPQQLLRDADVAMYQAKLKGKARYEIFDSKMHADVLMRLQLEADMRNAIEHGEFRMHYQPIMNLNDNTIAGFEALIRWEHPKRGLLYPMDFIPLAEETGMIIPIGEWIILESCKQLKKWQEIYRADPSLKMSMNVSGKQFSQPAFIDKIKNAVDEAQIDASSLSLEITESIIMDDPDSAIIMLGKLREMGIHIHIDDFGTGYSSLSYIDRFPVNALKIDRSFINKMNGSSESLEIIRAIVALAANLKIDVIAEGLELADQITKIKDMNCHYGQGFFFAKPMSSDDIDHMMSNNDTIIRTG